CIFRPKVSGIFAKTDMEGKKPVLLRACSVRKTVAGRRHPAEHLYRNTDAIYRVSTADAAGGPRPPYPARRLSRRVGGGRRRLSLSAAGRRRSAPPASGVSRRPERARRRVAGAV